MNELNELEAGVVRLKKNEEQQKRIIAALENEKEELIKNSNMFSERLNKMQESSQRIMDFVKNQIGPIKERLAEIGVELKSIDYINGEILSQKKRDDKNETVINKIINEISLMQKDLESIQILKRGLRDQSISLEETRKEMIGELERNIDSIKKDFETKRVEDIKNQMSEFRKEIKRIAGIEEEFRAYKKIQDSAFYKISQNIADLEGTLSEIKLLRRRAEGNEEFSKALDSKFEKLSRFQGDSLSEIRTELLKDLQKAADSIRKEFDEKRTDDNKLQLVEFKSEINRISNLEEELRGYKKSHDSELSRLTKSLDDAPSDIKIIKQRLSEVDTILRGFAENSVNRSEFSDLFSNLNKRLEDSENRLFSLNKKLGTERATIEKQIMEIVSDEKIMDRTQVTVRKAIAERIAEIDSRMSSNLKSIADQAGANSEIIAKIKERISGIGTLEENSDAIENLRERLTKMELISKQISENQNLLESVRDKTQRIDMVTKEIPERVDSVEHDLAKMNEARGVLLERSESLTEQLKTLEESLSDERQRIAAIEKEFGVTDKKKESRLDRIDRDIGDVRNALAEIDVIRSRLDGVDNFSRTLDSKLVKGLEQVRSEIEKRIDEERSEQSSRLSGEMKRLSDLTSEMDGYSKSQEKRFNKIQKDLVSLQDAASAIPGMGADVRNMETALQQNLSDSKILKSGYDSLSKQTSENSEILASIKERIVALDLVVSDVSKNQELITKIKERIAEIGMLPEHENEIKAINERMAALGAPIKLISSHESEIKKLTEKVSSLKSLIDVVGKHDSDIDEFSKTLVRLESFSKTVQQSVDNIHSMKERVTKLENYVSDVSDNTKSVEDLEERITGMEAVVSQIPKTMDMVQKIKDMIANIKLLPKTIEELGDVKERVVALELNTKPIPEVIDDIEKIRERITGIESNSKVFRVFSDQLKSFEKSLSEEKQRMAAVEKEFGITDKKKESRLDIIFQDISSIRQRIDDQIIRIETVFDEQKATASALHSEIDEKIKHMSRDQEDINLSLQTEIDERTKQVSQNQKDTNISLQTEIDERIKQLSQNQKDTNISLQTEIDERTKQVSQNQKDTNISLQTEIDERIKQLSTEIADARKEQSGLHMKDIKAWLTRTKEIEKELGSYMSGNEKRMYKFSEGLISLEDEIKAQAIVSNNLTKSLTKVEGMIGDVKALKEGVSYLSKMSEGLVKDTVTESEFIQTVKSVNKRIDDIESSNSETDSKLISEADGNRELINKTISDMGLVKASQEDIQNALSSRISNLEKSLSGDLSGLNKKTESSLDEINKIKESIAGISNLDNIVKGSVEKNEFIQTVESISKRIDDIESDNTDTDTKLVSEVDENKNLINNALSDLSMLRASHEDMQNAFGNRVAALEQSLSSDVIGLTKKAETSLAEINEIKERISGITKLENLSALSSTEIDEIGKKLAVMDSLLKVFGSNSAKIKEMAGRIVSLSDMTGKIESMEDEAKAYLKEMRGLQGELSTERERISRLESGMVSMAKDQEMRMRDMLDDQRKLVIAEIERDMSKTVNKIELSEEKRKRDFDRIIRESRELGARTKDTIKDFGRELANMPGIEEKLNESIEKMGVESMKKISDNQKDLVRRFAESEETIKKLSSTATKLETKISGMKDYDSDIEAKISELRDDIGTRIKTNEDIMDSEMDAFKNKVDYLAGQLEAWREVQSSEEKKEIKIVYPEGSDITPPEIGIVAPVAPTTRKEEINIIKKLSSKP